MDINEVISSAGYDFLRTDPRLEDRIALLTFGGSISYGLNTPESDIDIRGIIMPDPDDLLSPDLARQENAQQDEHLIYGNYGFEQYIDRETDTSLYVLSKIFGLLYKCNPNTIEILGCRPEHYTMVNKYGRLLLDNREVFLSKFAYSSFAGYARGQFQRLKNAIGKDNGSNVFKCISLADSIERIQSHLSEVCPNYRRENLKMYITDSKGETITVNGKPVEAYDVGVLFNEDISEITVNGKPIPDRDVQLRFTLELDNIPANEFNVVTNEITSGIKEFNKHLGHRNHKKDVYHLNKHAMHLIRLYLMGEDILSRGEIVTYREKEHDLLMSIKTGEFFNEEQNSLNSKFFDMAADFDKRMLKAYENSKLPDRPDMVKVKGLLRDIHLSYLSSLLK
ncbi:nucleotidyltransferase domain-containing protein [Ruminococcus sp.]|uniref:DNA polymerase beta superfamily protein n=1 Tax=Ruminococcus sp. TaxID=41978 RepID=UPI0025F1E1DD|nr:nucleotidyltransferase domain-containing protein [Ruminococcus sp.]MBQ8965203.1 nucleotidyltransferase domain-containing protein [Ruminococcus sp.]